VAASASALTDPQVRVSFERLKELLACRFGPAQQRDFLQHTVRALETLPVPAALSMLAGQLHNMARTKRALPPFGPGQCLAIVHTAPQRLAMLSSRLSFQQPLRGLPAAEAAGVFAHAAALWPAFGDGLDPTSDAALAHRAFVTGVAWHNQLTFRLRLEVGVAGSRQDDGPLLRLASAFADSRFAHDEQAVPVALLPAPPDGSRAAFLLVVRGNVSPDEAATWLPNAHGEDPPLPVFVPRGLHAQALGSTLPTIDAGPGGDGSFAGVRALLEALQLSITPLTLPALVSLLLWPLPWDARATIKDGDGNDLVELWLSAEDRLEGRPHATPSRKEHVPVLCVRTAGLALWWHAPQPQERGFLRVEDMGPPVPLAPTTPPSAPPPPPPPPPARQRPPRPPVAGPSPDGSVVVGDDDAGV
jgi:hypothetical protein